MEHLGNETLLTFEVGQQFWTAKWLGQWQVTAGDMVPVQISIDNMHFFDTQTTELVQAAPNVTRDQGVIAI